MSFLFPGFLFALFALAIPIIIHLFHFRRFKIVYFSNTKFLRNIREETATRNKLKHLLVLCARLLALAFLIFAFAQPLIKSETTLQQTAVQSTGIYIDNSFSMEAMDNGKQLLETAKAKAEEIVQGFDADDQFNLLTNDFEARHQRLVNKEQVLEYIRSVQISPAVKNLSDVVNRQQDILKNNNVHLYLISDFQQNTSDFIPDTSLFYTFVPIAGNEQRNIAVDSIWFTSPVQMLHQPLQLCYIIKNYGSEDAENVSIQCKISRAGGEAQTKAIANLNISAGSSVTDTMQFTITESGLQNCQLLVTDYPITFDDVFYFSFTPSQKLPVAIIHGGNENTFINSVYANSIFTTQQYHFAQIDYNALRQFSCIILNEVPQISSGLADVLQKKLQEGASILYIPSDDNDNLSINTFLANNGAAKFGEHITVKRYTKAVNTNSEIFSGVFEKLPENIALPAAEKSYAIEASSKTREEIILPFADGKPMLAKYKSGNGNIYLSASPFRRDATDLPALGGIFAPFMYRFALLSAGNAPLYVIIGKEQWVNVNGAALATDQALTVKNNNDEFIPALRNNGGKTQIDVSKYAKQAGIYTLQGNDVSQSIAMNFDRKESDLTFLDADKLREKFAGKNITIIKDPEQSLRNAVQDIEQGKPLWKYCVIFALLFLAVEIAVIRFMP
jgi:hypothetical protein